MYWAVVAFEILCWSVFAALLIAEAYSSYRRRKILPGLWMALGILSMSWIEAPFDNAMYVQFHPDFHRLPPWGPIGMTQGLLPVIAPPGYTMYFLLPAIVAAGLANLLIRRYRLGRANTLLAAGLVIGSLFDLAIESLQAQYLHLWVFSRVVPGFPVSSGIGLVPSYVPLAMGCFIMAVTYVLGNVNAAGDSVIDVWARTHFASPTRRRVAQAFGYILFCNALYLLTYLPHAITKYLGMVTHTGVIEPFPGAIGVQPESGGPQTHGALAATIIWGLLCGAVALVVWWAHRTDRLVSASNLLPDSQPAANFGILHQPAAR
ncbi:spirocyclase AveC family protein [uncultured Mycobacterium sp.]|uniref:spirocyclase AveC family protein n=1 Tax=uncultured Mycobacterium sp. TaxID=171292 RepID=UPI0035CC3F4E